jgi:hypothetical protein
MNEPHIGGSAELEGDESEFGLPQGLDVPGYENKPYAEGGRYKPKAPQCPRIIGT